MTPEQSPLPAMAAGVALALLVLLAAFFQDVLVRLARALFATTTRVAGPPLRRAGSAAVAGARGLIGVDRTPRPESPLASETAVARDEPAAQPAVELPSRRRGRRSAIAGREQEPAPSGLVETAPSDAPIDEVDAPASPLPVGERAAPERPSRRRAAAEEIGSRRSFQPASNVLVDERVRDFLERREGAAPIEAVVRHLDFEFGPGMGSVLIESLRRRRIIAVERPPDDPVHLRVRLIDAPGG